MSVSTYEFTVPSSAPPDVVFAVLADATRWKEWAGSMISVSEWDREGDPAPGGVGAVRKLGRAPAYAFEQILEYDPPHHLAYTIVRGLPVRGYHADVDLVPAPGAGTTIRWSGAFEPKIPGTGAMFAAVLGRVVRGYGRAAAAEAERRVAQAG
jgi:Polyketide cyclase / dehydrase and lipid transport